MVIKVKLDEGAVLPTRAHDTDAGLDLYTPKRVVLRAKDYVTIDTGVHAEIPCGYFGDIRSKSGLMRWNGITTDGTVDSGYSGSICVTLFNRGDEMLIFGAGAKIAQMVIVPCLLVEPEEADEIAEGERGGDGFGSTGQ